MPRLAPARPRLRRLIAPRRLGLHRLLLGDFGLTRADLERDSTARSLGW